MKKQGQEQWAEITARTKKIKLDWIVIDNTKTSSYQVQLYVQYDLPNGRAYNDRKVMSRQHMMSSRKL